MLWYITRQINGEGAFVDVRRFWWSNHLLWSKMIQGLIYALQLMNDFFSHKVSDKHLTKWRFKKGKNLYIFSNPSLKCFFCFCTTQNHKSHWWKIHGVHQQHQDVSEVRIQREWKDHPLDRSTVDPLENAAKWLICLLPFNWTLPFLWGGGAGLLPAEASSAQRRSKWFGGTQSAHGADSPSFLSGTVSAPQAAEGGRDGETGPAGPVSISGGQCGHLVRRKRPQTDLYPISNRSHSSIIKNLVKTTLETAFVC